MREPETPAAFRVLFYMGNVLALSGANGCKCGFLLCDKRKVFLPLFFIVYENCIENAVKLC